MKPVDSNTILSEIDRIRNLPTLPVIVFEANKLLRDPEASTSKVSQLIETDQSIAMKILKLVNSAFYGCPSNVNDLSKAIMLLGFNTVRNAILSVSVIEAFTRPGKLAGFKQDCLWRHSVAVAVVSKKLAELTRTEEPGNCFVGGLLHDIGKVILSQYFKELFAQIWTASKAENLTFYSAEKKAIQVDHAMIGSHLADKWAFPKDLVDTIRHHHDLKEDVDNYHQLVIVHVADLIINNLSPVSGYSIDITSSRISSEMSKVLAAPLGRISKWYPELVHEIDAACSFFLDER